MIKINIKTKAGYRLQNISNESFVNYRKTKQGYSKKSELQIKKIHEKIIEERAVQRHKIKLIQIKEYQKIKRIAKKRSKVKKIEKIEEQGQKQPIKYFYNWLCTCLVSDRVFPHIFGVSNLIGSDEEYVIREHEKYYPDHELKNIEVFDMAGENQKELHEELKNRRKYITKTEGIYFYD